MCVQLDSPPCFSIHREVGVMKSILAPPPVYCRFRRWITVCYRWFSPLFSLLYPTGRSDDKMLDLEATPTFAPSRVGNISSFTYPLKHFPQLLGNGRYLLTWSIDGEKTGWQKFSKIPPIADRSSRVIVAAFSLRPYKPYPKRFISVCSHYCLKQYLLLVWNAFFKRSAVVDHRYPVSRLFVSLLGNWRFRWLTSSWVGYWGTDIFWV